MIEVKEILQVVTYFQEIIPFQWRTLGPQLVYFLIAAIVSFLILGRRLNPFVISGRKRTRNQMRFARHVAFALFQSSIVLFLLGDFSPAGYVRYSIIMSMFVIVPATIAYLVTGYKIRKGALGSEVTGEAENSVSIKAK